MAEPFLALNGLSKTYQDPQGRPVRAVDDFSLTVEQGEFVTLVGPSGCGKTTTLRIVAGFEIQDRGSVCLGGKKLEGLPPHERNTPMVFQSYALFPHLTVFENIAYGLRVRKKTGFSVKNDVFLACQAVNLTGMEHRYPHELSGGQQQRVALARVLVLNPRLILFDEPLSNLDYNLRSQTRNEIRRIQRMLGLTALYVTHDQGEALSLSDRVVVMNRGRMIQQGTPREIYHKPVEPFVSDFMGGSNFLSLPLYGRENSCAVFKVGEYSFKVPLEFSRTVLENGQDVLIGIKLEAVKIRREGPGIPAEVVSLSFLGPFVEALLEVRGSQLTALLTEPDDHVSLPEPGDPVFIHFRPEGLRLYPSHDS